MAGMKPDQKNRKEHIKKESQTTSEKEPLKTTEKESQKTSQDAFDFFQKNIENYFKNVSVNTATYLQTVSDLQQEIIESRKKNAESAVLLQKFLTEKTNSNVKVSDKSLELFSDFAEQSTKAWNFQNQLMIKSLDALSKNIQAFNDNSEALTEMNKKLIESWSSIIKRQKNIDKQNYFI